MKCSRAEEVSMLHDGALEPQEASCVEDHVASCEECTAFQRDLRSLSRLLASEKTSSAGSWASVMDRAQRRARSRRRWKVAMSLAAAALIAILGLIVSRRTASNADSVFVRYDGGGRAVIYVRKSGEAR